ncbi:unnamed protein product [marine sediment metagenome]|uniref:Uncharacterized protein n=1 Tax=marine sediment metagenome TaxID=412755 RepID=X1JQR1_9ZZZZ
MNCEFLEPVYWNKDLQEFVPVVAGSVLDLKDTTWNFTKMVCDEGLTLELIQGPDDREFFVQKTLTYGEAIIIWFLTLFLVGLTAKIIFDFFWKK